MSSYEKSVPKTLEELLAFSAQPLEFAASCMMDIDSEIYRFKCNQCKIKLFLTMNNLEEKGML